MCIVCADENRYCIFQASIAVTSEPPVWKLDIVERPKYLLQNAIYMNDYILDRRIVVVHQRVSRSGEIKQFQSTVTRQPNYFNVNGVGIIPFMKFNKKAGLPLKFQKVLENKDQEELWHFKLTVDGRIEGLPILLNHSTPTVLISPDLHSISVQAPIPRHVFESFVHSEVVRGSTCPISLEPLTAADSIVAPPCCHLFRSAAFEQLQTPSCPVCRLPFTPLQLLRWQPPAPTPTAAAIATSTNPLDQPSDSN